jgi:hypothetical protein
MISHRWVPLVITILFLGNSFLYAEGTLKHVRGDKDDPDLLNLVLVAEAYTQDEEQLFSDTVAGIVSKMFNRTPYKEYSDFINVWQLFVPSEESGASHGSTSKDTYFEANLSGVVISFNKTTLYDLLAEHIPDYDMVGLLVNEKMVGGCSYGTVVALTVNVWNATEVLMHELGHGFARLADEYDSPYSISPTEMRNVTAKTDRDQIRWKDWILPDTPLPTPELYDGQYDSVVGLYEGAMYQKTGWYRPKLRCMMKSTSGPFCEICVESHVVQLYSQISPVIQKYPDSSVINNPADSTVFSVVTRTPHPNTQTINWFLDGKEVYSGAQLPLNELTTELNSYVITAIVCDTTPLVRNPFILNSGSSVVAGNVLNDTVTWHVNTDPSVLIHTSQRPAAGVLSAAIVNGRLIVKGLQSSTRPVGITIYTPAGKSVFYDRHIVSLHSMSTVSLPLTNISNGLYIVTFYDESSSIRQNIRVLCAK